MGVDTQTYRSRVGCFVSCRGAREMPSFVDFSKLVRLLGVAFVLRLLFILVGKERVTRTISLVIGIETEMRQWRVRHFVSCNDAEGMSLYAADYTTVICLLGVVLFIRMLLLMAGIEQNPGPVGALTMNDPEFKNWIKAAYGFKYLKEGLLSFVSYQITQRYRTLKQNVAQQHPNLLTCTNCTSKNLLPDHGNQGCNQRNRRNCFCRQAPHTRRTCPNNFCSSFYHLIVDDHIENTPRWTSTDPGQWSSDCFQYAKCFLGTHSPANTFDELDCTGVLSIVIHNRHFLHSIQDVGLFKRCRESRNNVFHSGDYRITDQELNDYIDDMIHVLKDRMYLINDLDAQQMVISLNELKTKQIHITEKDLDKFLQDSITEIKELRDEVKQYSEDFAKRLIDAIGEIRKQRDQALDEIEKAAGHVQISHEIVQKNLIDLYWRRFKTLPMLPLFQNKDENLLKVYKNPTMKSVKCNGDETKNNKDITCYKEIFCKSDDEFQEIYIVGDAGVGKTSFCAHMSLLWCYAHDEHKEEYKTLHKDVEYMSKFEFVFFVSLRETCHTRVIDMIIEQLFEDNQEEYRSILGHILGQKPSLILMDGLDEWMPSKGAGELPGRKYANNIFHITTSRPHQIENVRPANRDVDHLIEITGISGVSSKSYIEDVITYMNKERSDNKNVSDFIIDMDKYKLDNIMCIPVIASQLVVLWFERTMADMPRAFIYANILEMLFKRAELRGLNIPSSTESKFKRLPDFLSGLNYLNKHASLLYNVCHLSFKSYFKHDENASNLVFTEEQLLEKPYYIDSVEIHFLCKIGILSKNEFRWYPAKKLKLSFIHKSYIEFFTALFISSDDTMQLLDERWKSLDYVLRHDNLILLLVGFFTKGGNVLFDRLYQLMSDDLSLCRRNSIFHYNTDSFKKRIESLQTIVIKCYKELSRSNESNIVLKHEDFIFDDISDVDILKKLLLLQTGGVKSVYSVKGKYCDAFDKITNLQILHVGEALTDDFIKFTTFMVRNQSTLHTVCIEGNTSQEPLLLTSEIPTRSLDHLTALSLSGVTMQHCSLQYLLVFLCDNVLIENIKLSSVSCDDHPHGDSDCTLTLDLPNHTYLKSLCLHYVNILCNYVNKSSLMSIQLCPPPFSKRIVCGYIDIFNCNAYLYLEHLDIHGGLGYMLDDKTMRALIAAVKTLPYIKFLKLELFNLPDDVFLQLHPDVTQVAIEILAVTMSDQCFNGFIESFLNKKSVITTKLSACKISLVDGGTREVLSYNKSIAYMSEYLKPIQNINIIFKSNYGTSFYFETTSCQ